MVHVALTKDWKTPMDGGDFVGVADLEAAYEWIRKESIRRNLRRAAYTRTIVRPFDDHTNVVDFGDYTVFGLLRFGTKEETNVPSIPAVTPTDPEPPSSRYKVLSALPMLAKDLEAVLHAMCDEGRWDWRVVYDRASGKLVLMEP